MYFIIGEKRSRNQTTWWAWTLRMNGALRRKVSVWLSCIFISFEGPEYKHLLTVQFGYSLPVQRISMKDMQASWASSSWLTTFFSSGCFSGSLVQLHILSFPRFLVTITLLRVCLGGGLKESESVKSGQSSGNVSLMWKTRKSYIPINNS